MPAVFALIASVFIGSGIALQHRQASAEDPHAVMDPRLVLRLLRRKTWLLGMAVSTAGFAFQATAIATGRLVVVAPISSMNVLVALLLSARHAGRRLGPREWRGAGAAVVGVAGFLVVAAPKEAVDPSELVPWAVPLGILAAVVVPGVLLARTRPPAVRGVMLAAMAGLSFGCSDALIKVFTEVGGDHGLGGVLGHWGIYTWMVVSPMAFLLQQSAFHATHLGAAMPATSTLSPTTASVLGALMFGDRLRGGPAIPLELALFGLMLLGVFLLSSSPLIEAAAEPGAAGDPDADPDLAATSP
jgi:drug/metabolite transporter (DMT)-like permease